MDNGGNYLRMGTVRNLRSPDPKQQEIRQLSPPNGENPVCRQYELSIATMPILFGRYLSLASTYCSVLPFSNVLKTITQNCTRVVAIPFLKNTLLERVIRFHEIIFL